MDVTKPYEFIGFGAMDVTKPCEFIGFGAMEGTKPYKFIGFGGMEGRDGRKAGREPAKTLLLLPAGAMHKRAVVSCIETTREGSGGPPQPKTRNGRRTRSRCSHPRCTKLHKQQKIPNRRNSRAGWGLSNRRDKRTVQNGRWARQLGDAPKAGMASPCLVGSVRRSDNHRGLRHHVPLEHCRPAGLGATFHVSTCSKARKRMR